MVTSLYILRLALVSHGKSHWWRRRTISEDDDVPAAWFRQVSYQRRVCCWYWRHDVTVWRWCGVQPLKPSSRRRLCIDVDVDVDAVLSGLYTRTCLGHAPVEGRPVATSLLQLALQIAIPWRRHLVRRSTVRVRARCHRYQSTTTLQTVITNTTQQGKNCRTCTQTMLTRAISVRTYMHTYINTGSNTHGQSKWAVRHNHNQWGIIPLQCALILFRDFGAI